MAISLGSENHTNKANSLNTTLDMQPKYVIVAPPEYPESETLRNETVRLRDRRSNIRKAYNSARVCSDIAVTSSSISWFTISLLAGIGLTIYYSTKTIVVEVKHIASSVVS